MNIIVKPQESTLCHCRPDTTWERENKDFYVPECAREISWAPVMFVRISKAGKCINPKFVSRYYDSFNFGTLLYCVCEEGAVSCADHTSRLPFPLHDTDRMEEGNVFQAFINAEEVFSATACKEMMEDAICKASQMTSVRIGDLVAVELDKVRTLTGKEDGETRLKATLDGVQLYDFRIIF